MLYLFRLISLTRIAKHFTKSSLTPQILITPVIRSMSDRIKNRIFTTLESAHSLKFYMKRPNLKYSKIKGIADHIPMSF